MLCFSLLQGRITYAFTRHDVDHHCGRLLQGGVRLLGFDIEWRVTFQYVLYTPSTFRLLHLYFFIGCHLP